LTGKYTLPDFLVRNIPPYRSAAALILLTGLLGIVFKNPEISSLSLIFLSYYLVSIKYCLSGKNRQTLVLLVLCVTIYHITAFLNSYLIELPGVRPDSLSFLADAQDHVEVGEFSLFIDYEFYTNLLGLLYYAFGVSYYLGSEISVLALTISLLVLDRILKELDVDRARNVFILMCALLPSTVIIGTSPMREASQLLLLQTTVLFAILTIKNNSLGYFMLAVVSALTFGMFHKAMLFVGVIATFIVLVLWVKKYSRVLSYKHVIFGVVLLGGLILAVGMLVFATKSGSSHLNLREFRIPKLLMVIQKYRDYIDSTGEPNTAYGIIFKYDTVWESISSLFRVYVYYLFYPVYIKGAVSLKEIYAVFETWLRLGLFGLILYHTRWVTTRLDERHYLVLVLYLLMTFIWSLGTTNYGQAIRHHVLSNWLLIVLLASCLAASVNDEDGASTGWRGLWNKL